LNASQVVITNWDAYLASTGATGTESQHLIGSYEGWNPILINGHGGNKVFIAGYNVVNSPSAATTRWVIVGGPRQGSGGDVGGSVWIDLKENTVYVTNNLSVTGSIFTGNLTVSGQLTGPANGQLTINLQEPSPAPPAPPGTLLVMGNIQATGEISGQQSLSADKLTIGGEELSVDHIRALKTLLASQPGGPKKE